MSATALFLKLAREQVRDMVVLVRISPRDPATLAETPMYFSTAVVSTPAGGAFDPLVWLPRVIEIGSIAAPGKFGDTDLELCSCTIVLDETAISPAQLLLDNAPVSVWLWERSLTSMDDACCVLNNARVLSWSLNGETLTLEVRQRTEWNNDIVPTEVTAAAYPQAPDDSLGQRIPVVYGAMRDVPFRPPWPEYPQVEDVTSTTVMRGLPLILGGRRAGSAIVVDAGRGSGAFYNPATKVLCASHKVKKVGDHLTGNGFYMKGTQDRLIPIDTLSANIVNTTTEAGILLPDNSANAWVAVLPSEVDPVSGSAENFRAILDPWNDTNYSKLDWSAGFKTLRLKLPTLEDLGELVGLYLMVAYSTTPTITNLKFRIRNVTNGTAPVDSSMVASTARRIMIARMTTLWGQAGPPASTTPFPFQPWAFGECEIEVGWPTSTPVLSGAAGEKAEIYFAGFVVNFKPRQDIYQTERVVEYRETIGTPRINIAPGVTWSPYTIRATLPAVMELKGRFFANVDGYGDDGEFSAAAGDFTGTANALIERGPDILAHMLVRYGAEDISKLEMGSGYGSFPAARAKLQTPRKQDMKFALSIGQTADMRTAIAWMSQATLSLVILDRFTDTWRMLPWRTDAAKDYGWTFRPQDVVESGSLKVERTPLGNIMTGLALAYSHTADKNTMLHRTRLAWDGSDAGFKYRDVRDAYETVVAGVNDRLDFGTSAAFTANLTPTGQYDPAAFGQMVAAAMKTANSASEFCVSWGPTILAGYNDSMAWFNGPSTSEKTIAIQPGQYASWEDFCAYISSAMTAGIAAAGVTATATFDRTTRLLKIQTTGPSSSCTLHNATGTNWASRRFYATLGYAYTGDQATSGPGATANSPRDEETFAVTCLTGNLTLPWETGTNGANGLRRNAAGLLGFLGVRDSNVASTRSYLGDSPKSNAEDALLQTAQRYGARRDTIEDLRAVLDTDTAREVRNRVARLMGKPRCIVTFSTNMAPDIERGRVIGFTSDFDAVLPYPDTESDGSWLGKRFVVVETEQMLGPIAFYTKIRAVSLD